MLVRCGRYSDHNDPKNGRTAARGGSDRPVASRRMSARPPRRRRTARAGHHVPRRAGAHREAINRLNVYPVPDGDTGTNMSLTLESVVVELDAAPPDMAAVCKAISHGSLMGARGNSGVILSQVLRGLTGVLREHVQRRRRRVRRRPCRRRPRRPTRR